MALTLDQGEPANESVTTEQQGSATTPAVESAFLGDIGDGIGRAIERGINVAANQTVRRTTDWAIGEIFGDGRSKSASQRQEAAQINRLIASNIRNIDRFTHGAELTVDQQVQILQTKNNIQSQGLLFNTGKVEADEVAENINNELEELALIINGGSSSRGQIAQQENKSNPLLVTDGSVASSSVGSLTFDSGYEASKSTVTRVGGRPEQIAALVNAAA